MYTILLVKERGWKVLTSCSGRNAEFVTTVMGADEVVNNAVESGRNRVRAWNPDAIEDCVGGTECLGIARRYVSIIGDNTARTALGGSISHLFHPRMMLRWLCGQLEWGEKYNCIMLDQKKEYLEEAVGLLPLEKIRVDSSFALEYAKQAFERLNTGRAWGKVVVEIS